jgi:uncharacterized membrane protein
MEIALIPWILNLAQNLPPSHLAEHWDTLWVGFDVLILISVALTAIFIIKRAIWVIMSATAVATLFIVDAWFDIMTSKPGDEQNIAIAFGVLEILLALFTYRLVFHLIHHSTAHKKVKLTTKRD